jgi:hypothetical protein
MSNYDAAFQGSRGAFSELACEKFLGPSARLLPCARFEDVFEAVSTGAAQYGVIPVENTQDIFCMLSQEFFDVITVDLKPAAVAVICCEWFCTSQLTEANPSIRRPDSQSGDSASCFASQVSAEKEADLFYHCLP